MCSYSNEWEDELFPFPFPLAISPFSFRFTNKISPEQTLLSIRFLQLFLNKHCFKVNNNKKSLLRLIIDLISRYFIDEQDG